MADREEETDYDDEPLMTRAVRVGGMGDDSDEEIEVVEEGEVEVCEDDTLCVRLVCCVLLHLFSCICYAASVQY
jgi:hypothetical protein